MMFRKTYSSITLSVIFSTISLSAAEVMGATEVENIQYDQETGSLDKKFENYTTVGNIQAKQGTINVTFEKGGVVQGSITSHQETWTTRSGTNNIVFKSSDIGQKNQILGDIYLIKGINHITMEGKNEIFGNIKVNTYGYRAQNSLLLKGESSQLGKSDKKINLFAQSNSQDKPRFNRLKFSSKTNTLYIDKIEAYFSGSQSDYSNTISLDGSNNTVTINTLKASGNYAVNAIGKNILTGEQASALTENTNNISFVDDTNAFEGVLQVGSISSSNGGKNNISYKASANILATTMEGKEGEKEEGKVIATQNAIIGSLALNNDEATKAKNLLKTAISGNNNLYLDLSKNTDFADVNNLIKNEANLSQTLDQESLLSKTQAVILGNIDNQDRGTNNIKIVGGSSKATDMMKMGEEVATNDHIKIGLVGNITTNGGSNNLIFENSIWLPSYLSGNENSSSFPLPPNLSGTLINRNNGTTNIVLRTSSATLNN
ncbi:hypothetical protein, partial [Helicobacter anatolicus]|uniref:hypothetical protein n=1 Tax=Helicobacter anatolicus TaxID=2905874 RepID=UPI001E5ADA28